ncbi:cupredoxin domain-containing protein [Chitinasiproducens palmae]|uniref:Cytochrome c oxidase subunit 2 n=1 Tax=Chitinasiproducens palmae TaxID=1770053 RepID=A0A1H2PTU1_9BURK|nr:cytochrome C oxidase subunit II [Chitinasiproducens palmae]SDV50525.1 cytochrome c oxidase subunit 2 [Chitinasiproducens palmae]
MSREHPSSTAAHRAEAVAARVEKRWAYISVGLILLLIAVMIYSGLHSAAQPPSRVETIDPATLHLSGEFTENNLGTTLQPDGSAVVRVVAQIYSFTPQCILVPAQTPLTFRATSSDVVHGFLVYDTNINTMVEPGFVSTFRYQFDKPGDHLMPCHEFCGTGHEGMWARVKVIEKSEYMKLAAAGRGNSCVQR